MKFSYFLPFSVGLLLGYIFFGGCAYSFVEHFSHIAGLIGGAATGVGCIYLYESPGRSGGEGLFMGTDEIYVNLILALISELIKVDGNEGAAEMRYVDLILDKNFKPSTAAKLKSDFRRIIEKGYHWENICKKINDEFEASAKIQVIQFLCAVATCDGYLTDTEYRFILNVSEKVRIPFKTFKAILSLFSFKTSRDKAEHKKNFHRKKKIYGSKSLLSKAYELMELDENVTDKEVKKAYRTLAKKHHPDRVIHMGEGFQKMAKERFQKVQEAYELIKAARDFN